VILIGFSGKKQSGKDSAARFVRVHADVLFGRPVEVHTNYFGGPMKDFAVKYLGVERHKVWGTDAQKNELTHIRWETLPGYDKVLRRAKEHDNAIHEEFERSGQDWSDAWRDRLMYPKIKGLMTGRQLLQYIGEEMFLEMCPDIWIRQFEHEVCGNKFAYEQQGPFVFGELLGLCADPRKPEQIACLQKLGGKVIRFLRGPYADTDRHISEIALDPDRYDQGNFDAVIDNRNLTVVETNRRVLKWLRHWGLVTGQIDLTKIDWAPRESL
jgi:hypothetical protein